jgi:hypothetical protein
MYCIGFQNELQKHYYRKYGSSTPFRNAAVPELGRAGTRPSRAVRRLLRFVHVLFTVLVLIKRSDVGASLVRHTMQVFENARPLSVYIEEQLGA